MFTIPDRASLPDQVYAQLRDQIVSGDREPGEALPSERALAELLGINRGAVREALKRLAEARLIAVRQGEATRVLDYRRTAGIELLSVLVLDADGAVNPRVVRSIMEMRSALAPALAAAAAKRAGASLQAPLAEALQNLKSAPDNAQRARASQAFWDVLVDGSQNIAYRLAFNSLSTTTDRLETVIGDLLAAEFGQTETYAALAEAVAAGDAAASHAHATTLVNTGEQAIGALLELLAPTASATAEDT